MVSLDGFKMVAETNAKMSRKEKTLRAMVIWHFDVSKTSQQNSANSFQSKLLLGQFQHD